MTVRLNEITIRRLQLPLITPYRLSYYTFSTFEPILVCVSDGDGHFGFGEGHISPGSSSETREQGWMFCSEQARKLIGCSVEEAIAVLSNEYQQSPVAATALLSAIEMLDSHRLLEVDQPASLPLLTPFNALTPEAIVDEVESRLAQGFKTFKLKVGKDVEADIKRVTLIQQAVGGRAILRIDANRGYKQEDACRFVQALDPADIALFEQPCASDDWEANATVAKASAIPLMLDEPICSIADIERAATLENVGFCKLKLKRFGGLENLHKALLRVRELGMEPVLGDGLSSEPGCWMEACVARSTINNAGEFNGFLKPSVTLFKQPLHFADGHLHLQPSKPELDANKLQTLTVEQVVFDRKR